MLLGRRAASASPSAGQDPRPRSGPRNRDRYLDLWRAAALVRVVVYHVFGWVWLTVLFPAMGLMFALAGSLMASSLDRSGPKAIARRLRRLLPPLWAFAAVAVPLMLFTGWGAAPTAHLGWGELLWWIFPARTPPTGSQSWAWAFNAVLWYIVTYLWLVLLSPALLAAFRRWPWRTLAVAVAVPVASLFGVVQIGGYFNEQATNVGTYVACWLLGFAHHDGLLKRLPARRYAIAVAAFALAGAAWVLAAAWSSGSFDLNRIPGGNTFWSIAFVATVLRFRPRLDWLAQIRPLNRTVELLNARAVTIYLWHMPAGLLAAIGLSSMVLSDWAGNVVLRLTVVWLLTAVAVALLGWVEDLAARRSPTLIPRTGTSPKATVRPVEAPSTLTTSTESTPALPVPRRIGPGDRWHRGMVATVATLAACLAFTALNVLPGTPTQSQDRHPRHETMHYLSDLLLVLEDPSAPEPAAQSIPLPPTPTNVDDARPRGVVTPAPSRLRVHPPPGCERLRAVIEVVDTDNDGVQVTFAVRTDGVTVYESSARSRGDLAEEIDVDVTEATFVDLVATSSAGRASTIWADGRFVCIS
ncbi:acyltransferase family protein [Micromonospora polyrhachis]|uniref:Peptidoglycan/LPS O-acetylase OafA/YrhL n=1 Tax=Micromonospora polyrhachis TaxID=1282883 RepID=A0A7W7SPN0_9ACTN|nr:acyltransferase family protein [Micromonospora polyrhachis]MBB4958644.1 peptidoglycan/LPS O-acetylase OafA/YrhL [Micromonospora polyrhachis]